MEQKPTKEQMVQAIKRATEKSAFAWAVVNKVRNEKNIELEFKDRPFLKAIFDDMTPEQTGRKASQIGWSTTEILKIKHIAKYQGLSVIYTLPTFNDVTAFVGSKVNPIIRNNPELSSWVRDKDTVFLKQVGDSFVHFMGTFTSDKDKTESNVGIMLTADIHVADESDRSDQFGLEQFESRLKASNFKGKWHFSNPSHPNTKSDKMWQQSDQKHWFVKCPHCGEWQYLDFPQNIVEDQFVCKKCFGFLDGDVRRGGQWVQRYKGKSISGYWINHLMCPWIRAEEIRKDHDVKTKQYFENFVMGRPYIGSDVTIDKNVILKCIDYERPNFLKHNFMGCDSGLKKHYVIGNEQGIFKVGVVNSWEDIEQLLKVYDIERAVFDALPDLTEPRKLQQKYPGIVWLAYFKKQIDKSNFIRWNPKERIVQIDRTKAIQDAIDKFVNRKTRIQLKPEQLELFIKHWSVWYKMKEIDSLNIERDIWESSDSENHFALATVYWISAMDKSGETMVGEWKKEEQKYSDIAPSITEIIKKNQEFEDQWN